MKPRFTADQPFWKLAWRNEATGVEGRTRETMVYRHARALLQQAAANAPDVKHWIERIDGKAKHTPKEQR